MARQPPLPRRRGLYRRGPYDPFHLLAGAMGKWTSPNGFLLDLNFIANINHYTLRLRFQGDQLEMTADEASGLSRDGRIFGTRRPPRRPLVLLQLDGIR